MKIRLDQIGEEPVAWRETPGTQATDLERGQLLSLGTIDWSGRVEKSGSELFLSAHLKYEQELACPRCLGASKAPVAADVSLLIAQESERPQAGEHELKKDDLDVFYVETETLDTDEVLMEQLQLNVPMRQLCREGCAGLCPNCGTDLNRGTCSCSTDSVDPRWQALAGLRERLID